MYNELCKFKDTEGNITFLLLLYYLIQLCTGGAISPTSLLPRCSLVSVSPGISFYKIIIVTDFISFRSDFSFNWFTSRIF